MARKEKIVTIDAEGRDRGKVFFLREMPASQAERWAARALMALAKSGVEVPDNITAAGLAGMAALGLKALFSAHFEDVEPLMAEMFGCVLAVPNPSNAEIRRPLIEDDIEEVATRVRLRAEVIELHTGFSLAAALSTSPQVPAADGSN